MKNGHRISSTNVLDHVTNYPVTLLLITGFIAVFNFCADQMSPVSCF
jgi:hypothetical protein